MGRVAAWSEEACTVSVDGTADAGADGAAAGVNSLGDPNTEPLATAAVGARLGADDGVRDGAADGVVVGTALDGKLGAIDGLSVPVFNEISTIWFRRLFNDMFSTLRHVPTANGRGA